MLWYQPVGFAYVPPQSGAVSFPEFKHACGALRDCEVIPKLTHEGNQTCNKQDDQHRTDSIFRKCQPFGGIAPSYIKRARLPRWVERVCIQLFREQIVND